MRGVISGYVAGKGRIDLVKWDAVQPIYLTGSKVYRSRAIWTNLNCSHEENRFYIKWYERYIEVVKGRLGWHTAQAY